MHGISYKSLSVFCRFCVCVCVHVDIYADCVCVHIEVCADCVCVFMSVHVCGGQVLTSGVSSVTPLPIVEMVSLCLSWYSLLPPGWPCPGTYPSLLCTSAQHHSWLFRGPQEANSGSHAHTASTFGVFK